MLIFRARRATVIRIPSLAPMIGSLWVMAEAATLAAGKHASGLTGGFALAVFVVLALGMRIVRRVGDEIVSTGILGSRSVPARDAVLGVSMRGGGRYWHLALDLMAHRDFRTATPIEIDSFQPNGIAATMRAARRAASLLGLAEPILAPGLSDSSARTDSGPHADDGSRLFSVRERWAAASNFAKFLLVAAVASGVWMIFSSVVRPGAQLELTCVNSWQVRDAAPTFNFTCQGRSVVAVDAGPATLAVWDPARSCWIERRFVVPKRRRVVVNVDRDVKASPCSAEGWPAPR